MMRVRTKLFQGLAVVAAAALLVLWSCATASAASHYIRAGATGSNDGTSWANAWPGFAGVKWIRGDTYFVAGGTYAENVVIGSTTTDAQWIVVKKANAEDNGKDPGWKPSYATDQAVINGRLTLSSGHVEINGVTGSGTTGHGIKISDQSGTKHVVTCAINTGPYRLLHLDVVGGGFGSSTAAYDGIWAASIVSQKELRIAYCWIHGVTRNGITTGRLVGTSYDDYGLLFENNVLEETGGCLDRGQHGQGMQLSYALESGFTIIRNNLFRNIEGSGMIVLMDGKAVHHDMRIYNNVFSITDAAKYDVLSPGAINALSGSASCANILIANNTFHGLKAPNLSQVRFYTPSLKNIVLANNAFEECHFTGPHVGLSTNTNNGYWNNTGAGVPSGGAAQVNGTASTFADAAKGDYTLKKGGYAVGAGTPLADVFTTDFAGNPRGAKWDIGAFAFDPNQPAPAPTTRPGK